MEIWIIIMERTHEHIHQIMRRQFYPLLGDLAGLLRGFTEQILRGKLVVAQQVNKFTAFYVTRKFTEATSPCPKPD
jgi:hypothetical protein